MKSHVPALLLLLSAAGCGYNTGFRLDELGIKTVGLEIASNLTFRQRLEFFLTRQVQQELESRVRTVLAPPGRADALLQVSILRASEPVLSEGVDDKVSVGSLALTVTASLVRRRTGEVVKEGRLADREEFFIAAGGTVEEAAAGVSTKIARRLVLFLDPEIEKLAEWRGPKSPSGKKEP
jgi:hypothetical protein